MAEIVYLNFPTTLLGRWSDAPSVAGINDVGAEYTIAIEDDRLKVTGLSVCDGEQFVISNISYGRDRVEFNTLMPSTGRSGHLVLLKSGPSDKVEMQFTFSDSWLAYKQASGPVA